MKNDKNETLEGKWHKRHTICIAILIIITSCSEKKFVFSVLQEKNSYQEHFATIK